MMRRTLPKTLTAGLLAVTLGLTSVAPSPARAEIDGDDVLKGLVTLLIIGSVVRSLDNDDDRRRPEPVVTPRPSRKLVPAQCLRTIEGYRHDRRVFMKPCLRRNMQNVNRLPDRCEMLVETRRGMRAAYGARCLERAGWRTTRH